MSSENIDSRAPPEYESLPGPRMEGDNLPDDFKYSSNVASCELSIRNMFLRKVYSLLSVQILGTLFVGVLIKCNQGVQLWCMNNMWLFLVSMISSFGFLFLTLFKARSYPYNLFFLGGFTLSEAYLIGFASSLTETDALVQAIIITFVVFIGLTLFAFQTKYDFISWQGSLYMALWGLIGLGFILMFFPLQSSVMELIYALGGCIIFSLYVVIDTQRIMKTCNLDDEIPAAMQLYMDILNLFLFILRLLDRRNDS